jgi:(E)-4-hydroxy-3-methylbut-2-enyl-diphosphate synthase
MEKFFPGCPVFEIKRKATRRINVGKVWIGGEAPVAVQSMTNTATQDVAATVAQIRELEAAGCELARVAVVDREAAEAISAIRGQVDIPVIADIHFDHRLAIAAARAGADGLRINPGNIGGRKKVAEVVAAAKDSGAAIRVGVNAGSLERDVSKKHGGATADALVESALAHIDHIRSLDFHNLKVSIKASDVPRTVSAYRKLSARTDLPLHVGVTEAGTLISGTVKSALGIGMLLADGIGDTLRVSLTGDPVVEVRVAWEILKALRIRTRGPEIVSCPTCGRCTLDLEKIVGEVEAALSGVTAPVRIAIMGCVVNGPGEAREADVGIAGGKGQGILFKKGKVVAKVAEDRLVSRLLAEIEKIPEVNIRRTK